MSKLRKLVAYLISLCLIPDNNHNDHKSKRVRWGWAFVQKIDISFKDKNMGVATYTEVGAWSGNYGSRKK